MQRYQSIVMAACVALLFAGCDRGSKSSQKGPGDGTVEQTGTAAPVPAETDTYAVRVPLGKGSVSVNVLLPEEYKINREAPTRVVLRAADAAATFEDGKSELVLVGPEFPKRAHATFHRPAGKVVAEIELYYCTKDETLCYRKTAEVTQSFVAVRDGGAELTLTYALPPDEVP